MNKFRRIGVMVAATVAATGMAMTVASAPAAAADAPKPHPQGQSQQGPKGNKQQGPYVAWPFLLPQNENTPGVWHKIYLKTKSNACNVRIHVDSVFGVKVDHVFPWFGGSSGLSNDPNLWSWETDYASVRISTGPTFFTLPRTLPVHISYNNCKIGKKFKKYTSHSKVLITVRNV